MIQRLTLCVSGEGGVDGDGDITRPENVTAFRNFVMENTDRRGLHFLMADGVRFWMGVIKSQCDLVVWISCGVICVFGRVFLWRVRRTCRRFSPNSCFSVSSSQLSLHLGQVCLFTNDSFVHLCNLCSCL